MALPSASAAPMICLLPSGCHGRPSKALDPVQDRGEQRARHRHLGQLEHEVATVAHVLAPILTSLSRDRERSHAPPTHERLEMLGDDFDTDAFTVEAANARIAARFGRW
jgi:hypothetical protein